jgi:uncharacterized membrane protein YbaN (DUF454 family)
LKKIFEITLGTILVILGIIGGLIPILQGWMFGIPGLILLARHLPWLRRLLNDGLDKLEPRFPRFTRSLRRHLTDYYAKHPNARKP